MVGAERPTHVESAVLGFGTGRAQTISGHRGIHTRGGNVQWPTAYPAMHLDGRGTAEPTFGDAHDGDIAAAGRAKDAGPGRAWYRDQHSHQSAAIMPASSDLPLDAIVET
jgi:hypothetical protein